MPESHSDAVAKRLNAGVAILVAILLIGFLLGLYVLGYYSLSYAVEEDLTGSAPTRVRYYRHRWQVQIYQPLVKLESVTTGVDVSIIHWDK